MLENSNSENRMKKFFKDTYNSFLLVLGGLAGFPYIAPILLEIGLKPIAKWIYFIYSFSCHQFDSRSIHFFDYQMAWCARDTAIWSLFFIGALAVKYLNIKPIKIYWLIPFVVPIALDGGIQTIFTVLDVAPVGVNTGDPLYISNNFVRFLTGAIFGIGLSLWIAPTIKMVSAQINNPKWIISLKTLSHKFFLGKKISTSLKLAVTLIIFSIIFYATLVFMWDLTSNKHKPEGNFDFVVRTAQKDFFTRRRHAVCATDGSTESNYKNPLDNVLSLDCFLSE